jgi:hypothetical protein
VVLPRVDLHGVLPRGLDPWWQLRRSTVRAPPAPFAQADFSLFPIRSLASRVTRRARSLGVVASPNISSLSL